ncbi:hypothetical protein AS034_18860 [[Bacillus] enclensis]|jgi:hypothetical protein|uniref:Uncharacterized protein n=2 Tax=Rossellomorea TaxID=2837508 RepID=A0A0V8H9W3_9BACI|nr:hypothetical protein [[Bacillus] enclensis]OAT80446.1 hypothetical protein A6P54_13710 [Bacillus sp. MKU004]QTC39959.1 hypothetical protein I7V34_12135 [Bacillus sp. V3]QWC22074.1 hypothetical protein KJK41_17620 [Bacillus haikouensis]KSU59485.1 hypothetical protein AS034_18860 [[Bacillus] enclensis]MBH9965564.1 hypothetical protein [[Bacillus] enclensis]
MTVMDAAQYLSYFMAIYLFAYSYVTGLKICESTKPVRGLTFILSVVMAFVFSCFTYTFS